LSVCSHGKAGIRGNDFLRHRAPELKRKKFRRSSWKEVCGRISEAAVADGDALKRTDVEPQSAICRVHFLHPERAARNRFLLAGIELMKHNISFYTYCILSLPFCKYEPKDCPRSSKRSRFHAIFPQKIVLSNII